MMSKIGFHYSSRNKTKLYMIMYIILISFSSNFQIDRLYYQDYNIRETNYDQEL